jgi:hypothetical protein
MQEPGRNKKPQRQEPQRSEFVDALQKGLLLGLGVAVLVVPPLWMKTHQEKAETPVAVAPRATAPTTPPQQRSPAPGVVRLADFSGEEPTPDARLVANWVVHTANNKQRAFVIVDKKDARVYAFSPEGRLWDSAPALLGAARGDDTFPGVGDKPIEQVRPEEKTTPAGRFVAEPGLNAGREDVVWVDYQAAVSMHRVRPKEERERRLERLATLTTDDNRISFGCINLPVSFYENVLNPVVRRYGAIVYVLPEVKTPQEVFGAFDVTDPIQLAAAGYAPGGLQQVALQKR